MLLKERMCFRKLRLPKRAMTLAGYYGCGYLLQHMKVGFGLEVVRNAFLDPVQGQYPHYILLRAS